MVLVAVLFHQTQKESQVPPIIWALMIHCCWQLRFVRFVYVFVESKH